MDPILPNALSSSEKRSSSDRRALAWIALESILFICCIAAVPLVVYVDAAFLEGVTTEDSITEHLHNGLLFITCAVFGIGAVKHATARGYFLMAVTFFTCLFLREMDATFDAVWKGFWVYPVLATLVGGTFAVSRYKGTVLRPLLRHYATRSGTMVYVGVFLLIIFTRLFGTSALWEVVMGVNYDAKFKGIIQEGLELMAYMLIAYGSCLALLTSFGEGDNSKG